MLEMLSTSPDPPRNIPANIRAVQHVITMGIIKCTGQAEEVNGGGIFKSREGWVVRDMGLQFLLNTGSSKKLKNLVF